MKSNLTAWVKALFKCTDHPGSTQKTVQRMYVCARVHQGVSEGVSHLDCVCTARPLFLFLQQTVRTESHRRELTFSAVGIFIWISERSRGCAMSDYVVCACVSSEEQDGLAPSLTRHRENATWQRGSMRERQGGRDLRSNSIIEILTHLNIEIVSSFWEPSSSISISCPLFPVCVSLLLFTSWFLKGELTDSECSLGQTEKHLFRRGGGMWGWQGEAGDERVRKKWEGIEMKIRRNGRQREGGREGEDLQIFCTHLFQWVPLLLDSFHSSLPLSLFSSFPSEVWNLQGSALVGPNLFTTATPAASTLH